jgi:GR25 family glycosyltransferase involved in LPS biosynthesis
MDWNKHFYINLDIRKDRNAECITELKKLGIKKPNRFSAIVDDIPLIGCAKSHIACLEKAKSLGWDYVLIFEDDIKIESKKKCLEKVNKYIKQDFWDVLYLGCWNVKPPIVKNDIAKVVKAWTTHAYIIKSHYYDKLIQNYKEGIELKKQFYKKHNLNCKSDKDPFYNIDEYLGKLQEVDNWYCLVPIFITQKDGFSDNFNQIRNLSNMIKHIPK